MVGDLRRSHEAHDGRSARWIVIAVVVAVVVSMVSIAIALFTLLRNDPGPRSITSTDQLPSSFDRACAHSSALRNAIDDRKFDEVGRLVVQLDGVADQIDEIGGYEAHELAGDLTRVEVAWVYVKEIGDVSTMLVPALRLELRCARLGLADVSVGASSDGPSPTVSTTSPVLPPVSSSTTVTSGTDAVSEPGVRSDCPRALSKPIHDLEFIAQCFYAAYRADDRAQAALFADPDAVDAVFQWPWEPPDWHFIECEETVDRLPYGFCYFWIDGEPHGVQVEMAMDGGVSAGMSVSAVEYFG